ncbi:hypothetical protein BM221_001952 [Beauveria bassiana]|uniref:Uncharacterized protein n=1 Tax=Beauveria bassiana TaxID=176275 RepID=A0A2N6NX57_BEABA|nr:hypothetical protein BM221_001952 [Beauveria bassiana]
MDATTTDRSYTDEELDREWKPKSRRPLSPKPVSISEYLILHLSTTSPPIQSYCIPPPET